MKYRISVPPLLIRTFLFLIGLFQVLPFLAQDGTIHGTLTVLENGLPEPQPFANVLVKGTTTGASTGLDGRYSMKVPPGTHTLVASFVGLPTVEREVVVAAGATVQVDLQFADGGQAMEAVQVVRERRVNSEAAVMMAVRNSDQVANGLGRQQIAKGQDRSAADAVRRIPGVTVNAGRFVVVRGLADRYNTVLLNGVAAPSMEADRRAFSFDLLPAGALDRMMVYKSGAPELPGDFAGGVIELTTMGVPEKNEMKVGYGIGFLQGTTFHDIRQDQRSRTDLLGFDDGSRALPADFPDHLNTVGNADQLAALGRELPDTWAASTRTAAPDQRFSLLIARRFGKVGARNHYGNVTSINLSNTSATWSAQRYNYNTYDAATGRSDTIYSYLDQENKRSAHFGVMHNWSALIGTHTKLEFRNLLNQLGENQVTERTGRNLEEGFDVRNQAFRYEQRTLYSGQLHGSHDLGAGRTNLDWTIGHGRAWGKVPDLRRLRTVRDISGSDSPYQVLIAPTASTLDAGRFFSDLDESTWTGKIGLEHKLGKDEAGLKATVRAGALAERKDRSFSARWMSFRKANTAQFDNTLLTLPPGSVFAAANINGTTGFKLTEGTNPSDRYTAANTLMAGYLGTTVAWAKLLTVSAGVRVEHNRQELEGATYGGQPVRVDNPLTHVLPSVNAAWNITERTLVRVAWSNTLNRPEFRELAPFSFYDFSTDNVLYGNPLLTTATIRNLDARWEWYPEPGATMSLGVFRKDFTGPIELFFVPGAGSGGTRNFTFRNAEGARSIGAELEVRRSLGTLLGSDRLHNLGLLLNGALVRSTVTLGPQAVGQANERPMMGQSPYVVNIGIFYADTATGLQCNVVYNIFGKRLFAVGSYGTPDIYEMPAGSLDASVGKDIGKRIQLKAGAQNLLNPQILFRQDGDGNGSIGSNDELISGYRRGSYFTMGITWSL
ncbi:MAG TPA: TonB-dependent receptor [Flavobacteriales bacterium]|nr:TonB-dependent receptor [Flavobacteriales bacterium]